MKIALFYHSLLSDWNHGNAHFLRGYATELIQRGHDVVIHEPAGNWSLANLLKEHGEQPLEAFREAYPLLRSEFYLPETLDLKHVLQDVDLVIVHEWNDHELVARIGRHRRDCQHFKLLFHDTHHRSVTDPRAMALYDLSHYDGVLAFGDAIRDVYLDHGWARHVWTWHEAADIRVFYPRPRDQLDGDLVWIGNWGDGERTAELQEFLLSPARESGARARAYGVRYPAEAVRALEKANMTYAGWLANFNAPEVFARFRMTVHIPRRPYVERLPGIPTIRPFEALACGIPLICSPWEDSESLFRPDDFLVARNGQEMKEHLLTLMNEPEFARALAERGRETILERHTCGHRVDELLEILGELGHSACSTVNVA
jgi:spore maturation protein CgeB